MTVANPEDPGTTNPQDTALNDGGAPNNPAPDGDKSILDPVDAPAAPQDWPDDWRARMLGNTTDYESEDDFNKELKRLEERFKSPQDVWKFAREAEKFAKSRQPEPQKPGPDATQEDIDKYRSEKGLPNSPQDYNFEFDDGFVFGEDVQEDVDAIKELAHQNNWDTDTAKTVARAFADNETGKMQAAREANETLRVETISALKQEWGGEFEGNINAVKAAFTNAPQDLMARFLQAKDPDTGLSIGNDPDTVRWLVDVAKTINPTATLVPSGKNDSASINDEISKIESMMWSQDKAERQKYRSDDAMQKRYRELLMAKKNMQG